MMSADVVTMIKSDHRELERLFDMMKRDKNSRPLALPLAVAMLTAHSRAEEDHVYPVLAAEAGEKEEAEHGAEEHRKAEQLGHELLGADPESDSFETGLQEWVTAVLHHVDEEEHQLLPTLSTVAGEDHLAELGQSFAARRAAELTGRGSGSQRRSSGKSQGAQGKTKAELMDQAREAGIKGRSAMSKDELERAVSRVR
jgi:hemerythrin superfamily protein